MRTADGHKLTDEELELINGASAAAFRQARHDLVSRIEELLEPVEWVTTHITLRLVEP